MKNVQGKEECERHGSSAGERSRMCEGVRARAALLMIRPFVDRVALVGGITGAALLVALSQPPIAVWWLACGALTPWLVVARSSTALVVGGLAWGTLSGIAMGHWVYEGLRNVGANPTEAGLGLISIAMTVTGLPAALYGASAVLARRLPFGASFAFAVAVGGIDAARAIPHVGLPWSLLGHSQAPAVGVAQLAALGGVPAISALLAGLSYSVAEALASRREGRRSLAWLPWLATYLALLLLGLPVARALVPQTASPTPSVRLLAIQHRISPPARWHRGSQEGNLALIGRRTLDAIQDLDRPPDLILWPETTLTVPIEEAPRVAFALRGWLSRLGAPLVLGGVSAAGSDSLYRNSAIWVEGNGRIRDRFDKTLAVPFVERAPSSWLETTLRRAFGADFIDRLVVEGREQRPLRGDGTYAVTLCYEVIYPRLVSQRIESDSLAILNLANDAWYGSDTPGRQQLAFARFRAIENRRYLVRVADSGPSAVVDPFGRIVRQLDPRATGAITADIEATGGPSPNERVAILSVAGLGAIVGHGARGIARRRWQP